MIVIDDDDATPPFEQIRSQLANHIRVTTPDSKRVRDIHPERERSPKSRLARQRRSPRDAP